jgi:hypothetical protein
MGEDMKASVLIYPSLIAAALTVMMAAFNTGTPILVGAAITFVLLLFLLVAIRRGADAKQIAPEFQAKLASLENQNHRQNKILSEKDAEVERLRADQAEAQTREERLKAQTVAYEAALQKAQNAEKNNDAEQAVIQFVRNLQSRGRLLDFLMTDIHKLPDPAVGAASRVVHQGLRDLMRDYFAIAPIASAEEGTVISVPKDELGKSYSLLQSKGDQIPDSGQLVHKGWKATQIRLPQSQKAESQAERSILAMAEIDLGGNH